MACWMQSSLHAELAGSACLCMQNIAKVLLDGAKEGLREGDRKVLQQLHSQSLPSRPLWDGKAITHRSAVNLDAMNTGDEAPLSWEGPHLVADSTRQAQCHALQTQGKQSGNDQQTDRPESGRPKPKHNASIREADGRPTAAEEEQVAKIEETKRALEATRQKVAAAKARKQATLCERQQNAAAGLPATETAGLQASVAVSTAAPSRHPDTSSNTPLSNPVVGKATQNEPESTPSCQQKKLKYAPVSQHRQDPDTVVQHADIPLAASPRGSNRIRAKPTDSSADNQGRDKQAACNADNGQSLDTKEVSAAKRRVSHAGLATAAHQRQFDKVVSNPPKVLAEPAPTQQHIYNPAPASPLADQHTRAQRDLLQPAPPLQQAPMTHSQEDSVVGSMPDCRGNLLCHDTASPMDIDLACQPWQMALATPFGQVPPAAFANPATASAHQADSYNSSFNNTASCHVQNAPTAVGCEPEGEPEFMEIDTDVC